MLSLNDQNFSILYEKTTNKHDYLVHFQNCMKRLNIFYYNASIHQNVNNMINKILLERYHYLTECNKLQMQSSLLHRSNVNEIAKTQQFLNTIKNLEFENKKLKEALDLTTSGNEQLKKKNQLLEESNIELNQKMNVFKQKVKSVKECEEYIGLKMEEIEKLKEKISADERNFDKLQNQIHDLKTQLSTAESTMEKLNIENAKLQNQLSNFYNNSISADQRITELQKTMDSLNSENQQLLNKNKILKEENFGLNQKITEIKSENDKKFQQLLTLKNYENEKLKKEIEELIKEKGKIIIEFSKRELNEKVKSTEVEKKLKEYENRRKKFTLEAEKACGITLSAKTVSTTAKSYEIHPKFDEKTGKGYILFSREIRKKIITENRDAGFAEISKLIGIEWNKLSNKEKCEYESRAQLISKERAEYVSQKL